MDMWATFFQKLKLKINKFIYDERLIFLQLKLGLETQCQCLASSFVHPSSLGVGFISGSWDARRPWWFSTSPPSSANLHCILLSKTATVTWLEWNSQPLKNWMMLLKIHSEKKGGIDFCCILYIEIYFSSRINISPFQITALKLLIFSFFSLNHKGNLFSNLLIY